MWNLGGITFVAVRHRIRITFILFLPFFKPIFLIFVQLLSFLTNTLSLIFNVKQVNYLQKRLFQKLYGLGVLIYKVTFWIQNAHKHLIYGVLFFTKQGRYFWCFFLYRSWLRYIFGKIEFLMLFLQICQPLRCNWCFLSSILVWDRIWFLHRNRRFWLFKIFIILRTQIIEINFRRLQRIRTNFFVFTLARQRLFSTNWKRKIIV